MSISSVMSRWKVVVGAVLIQLSLGAIYAWSVFTPALKAAGWSKLDTQVVFAVGLATFALVMVWAGRKLGDWGPQRLAVTGGLVLAGGYVLAGLLGGTGFWPVCIGIGVIGGAGIGLGYVVPIAVGMRWFPDRKGMITGLAVAGFGFGAMGWVKVAGSWGQLIEGIGLANTFLVYGAAFAVRNDRRVLLIAKACTDWNATFVPEDRAVGGKPLPVDVDVFSPPVRPCDDRASVPVSARSGQTRSATRVDAVRCPLWGTVGVELLGVEVRRRLSRPPVRPGDDQTAGSVGNERRLIL